MTERVPLRAVPDAAKAPPPKRGPARPFVHAAIRDAIVRAELPPGAKLSENELADRFGVSRTPIREALGRLRDDRLVQVVPQLGTYVSRLSIQAIGDAQFIREALECAAIRPAAEQAGEEDIAALEENLRSQERVRDSGDLDAWYLLDDGYAETWQELLETTDWDKFGRGKDPRCDNCMAHCGYEPTAVLQTTRSLRQSLRAIAG